MKQEVVVRKGGKRRNGKDPKAVYESKQDISYLKCHNALNRVYDEASNQLRCTNTDWIRYEKLEAAVLDLALHYAAAQGGDHDGAVASELEVEIAEAHRHLDDKVRRAATLADSFSRTASPSIERLLITLEGEMATDRDDIEALDLKLQRERASRPAPDHFQHVDEIRASIISADPEQRAAARVSMKQTLRSVVTNMTCLENRLTGVTFANSVRVVFDNEGNQVADRYTSNVIFTGPDGEIDWHPDEPDADYQHACGPC
jgi:hypothetical protein